MTGIKVNGQTLELSLSEIKRIGRAVGSVVDEVGERENPHALAVADEYGRLEEKIFNYKGTMLNDIGCLELTVYELERAWYATKRAAIESALLSNNTPIGLYGIVNQKLSWLARNLMRSDANEK